MKESPHRLYLDITSKCSSSCLHCYADSQGTPKQELSLPELKSLIDQMVDMKISELIISGGEPLMRKDIFDFLFYCKQKPITTTILTSGILLEEVNIKLLKEAGVRLRISLDGISKKTHDHIRGSGAFDALLGALELIRTTSVTGVSLHFTINRLNIVELLRVPCFLFELRIKDIVMSTIKPAGRALEHPELLMEPSLIPFIRERIRVIAKSRNINLTTYPEKNWTGFSCPAAFVKCGISSEGRITPCVFLGPNYIGKSLREYSLEYLWQNDEVMNSIRNITINSDCNGCGLLSINNGGCRARAIYYNHGDLSSIDPYCCSINKNKLSQTCLV